MSTLERREEPGQWWLLDHVSRRQGPEWDRDEVSGAIAFGGHVRSRGTGEISWQVEHPAHAMLDAIGSASTVLAAMGHPVRLELLRALIRGASTLAELRELPDMGTTGRLTHHLGELRSAGLIVSARRNHYALASNRVVPVLVMVAAALGPTALLDTAPSDDPTNP